ncbi:MAG: bifunctional diguanylate cyclase/phosphohydrolase [Thermoleophilia bacterium]
MSPRTRDARALRFSTAGVLLSLAYAVAAFVADRATGLPAAEVMLFFLPAPIAVLTYLLVNDGDRLRQHASDLGQANSRFSSLTHSAITETDWEVSLHDVRVPTCWEVQECDSHDCPAFGKHHIRCWLLAGTYCRGEIQGSYTQKLAECARCDIYVQAAGSSPMDAIEENFNCLMWAVRDKEEMLGAANEELTRQYEELQELQKQTRELADTDALTGMKNYGYFQREVKSEMARARRYGRNLSLAMLSVDHFQQINDRFGHQKGDQVLTQLGKLIMEEVRDADCSARYGGEKFAIVMPETFAQGAIAFCNRFQRKAMRVAAEADIPAESFSLSIGISDFPDCASDIDSLLSAADSALLFAGRQGENRVAYFCDLSETELRSGDIDRLNSRLEGAGLHTIRALAEAVDASDKYSTGERAALVKVASDMAERLGMDQEQADCLSLAACLHDIGKIGVPASVLQKTEKLSPAEMTLVQKHPEIGRRMLEEAKQIQNLVSAILYHHERWDGSGYPEGLQGEEIPLMARIVGILDTFRAMRCDRPYRRALSLPEAVAELRLGAGSQFDPGLVELFIELVSSGEDHGERLNPAV